MALLARDRHNMSLPKLAAFVREQLGEADALPSASLQVGSIESVRALQVRCTLDAASGEGAKAIVLVFERSGTRRFPLGVPADGWAGGACPDPRHAYHAGMAHLLSHRDCIFEQCCILCI